MINSTAAGIDAPVLGPPRLGVRPPGGFVPRQVVIYQRDRPRQPQLSSSAPHPAAVPSGPTSAPAHLLEAASASGSRTDAPARPASCGGASRPTTASILRHPQVALAVLEELLHPAPGTGHQRQGRQRRLGVRVRDGELEIGSAPSDRRMSNQDGGPGLQCRMPQTRIAANSNTSGPAAPSLTRSAVHAEAGSSSAIWVTARAVSRVGAVGLRPRPE